MEQENESFTEMEEESPEYEMEEFEKSEEDLSKQEELTQPEEHEQEELIQPEEHEQEELNEEESEVSKEEELSASLKSDISTKEELSASVKSDESKTTEAEEEFTLLPMDSPEETIEEESELTAGDEEIESKDVEVTRSESQKSKEQQISESPQNREPIFDLIKVKFCMSDDIERAIELVLNSSSKVKDALEELGPYINKDGEDMKLYVFYTRQKMHRNDTLQKYLMPGQEALICRVLFIYDDSSEESVRIDEEFEPDMRIHKVQIIKQDGTKKYLEVLIIDLAFAKEWCGGFRNKKTGVEYYNAWCQTNPLERGRRLPPGKRAPVLYTRDAQTHLPYVETSMNTAYDRSTQMWRRDFYIPSTSDKIIQAKPYTPIDEIQKRLTPHQAILIIQRFFRYCLAKWKLKKAVLLASEQNKAAVNFKGVMNEEIHKDRMDLLVKETFPLNRGDFYDLYTILGIWKQEQLLRIKAISDGVSRKAAIADLFEKEVECLYNIESQRIRSKNESLRKINVRALQNSARYKVKRYLKGNLTITDTLPTQRAREFKEIYSSYQKLNITKEERIDVIITFKSLMSKLDGIDITKDIIELLDREMDLIILNIPYEKMEGLRKRIESLFFNLIKSPEFNSRILELKSSNESNLKQPLYKCKGCGKVKPPSSFFAHLRLPSFYFCMSCSWMNTTANATINLAPYTRLLNTLRASETMKCCRSSVAFLLQPMGMYYIMNVIWQGQSAISGTSYLPELRMTRWNKKEEWAPWNTILLTEAEATVHDALDSLDKFYTRWFILKVKNKHILARMHFSKVYYTDLELRESGKWTSVKDEGIYTNIRHTKNLNKDIVNDFFKLPTGGTVQYDEEYVTRQAKSSTDVGI